VAQLAIAMLIAYGALTIGVRVGIQLRATGRTGFVGLRHAGPLGWLSAVLFNGGMAMAVISVLDVLRGSLDPIAALDVTALNVLGIVLAAAGGLAVFAAQLGMGASWRIGVSEAERTELVTRGWFSLVRNPVYSAMVVGWIGYGLIVPTWLGIAAIVVIALGLELLVRAVEEPYLLRTHGDEYRAYAGRVGRFVPGVGLWRGRGT
jgi:protein-S-isoprenylcysteine O-methyltransferase Ste14